MSDQFFENIAQLGTAAVIVFMVWQILLVVFKFFGKNEDGNAKEKGALTDVLMSLISSLNITLAENTKVLTEVKISLMDDRRHQRAALEEITQMIRNGFDAQDKKVRAILIMIRNYGKTLDDTIDFDKELLDELNED